jgi:pyruvate,water dikinase
MVQSEISGICFTVHPVTQDYDQLVIEAGYGLGEAIVGGIITPDTYVVLKTTKSEIRNRKSEKLEEENNLNDRRGESVCSPDERAKAEHSVPVIPAQVGIHIMDKYISQQEIMITKRNGVTEEYPIEHAKQELQKLTDEKIIELANICIGIENHYKFPCDIEWAMEKDKLYITQSRPITTLG